MTARLTLPHHFRALRSAIEPPAMRLEHAQTIPDDVRRYLQESTEFLTVAPHTRLIGSYRRHTAIHGIKDVDLLVFVPYRADGTAPDAAAVLDALYLALLGLPLALGYGGRTQILRRQRRSINVAFEAEGFQLDVVPALLPDGIDAALLVPDKEWSRWIPSDPLGYVRALSTLNTAAVEKAVPLIKLLKHWRAERMTYLRPKNYYLEAVTYRHLDEGRVSPDGKSYAELFAELLRAIRDDFTPSLAAGTVPVIPDPMLGHNLAFNWDRRAFETFMRRVEESLGWAERALATDDEHVAAAVVLWQKIFGAAYFVDTEDARMLEQADRMKRAGKSFVTAGGLVLSSRPSTTPAVETPRHRFYGDAG